MILSAISQLFMISFRLIPWLTFLQISYSKLKLGQGICITHIIISLTVEPVVVGLVKYFWKSCLGSWGSRTKLISRQRKLQKGKCYKAGNRMFESKSSILQFWSRQASDGVPFILCGYLSRSLRSMRIYKKAKKNNHYKMQLINKADSKNVL